MFLSIPQGMVFQQEYNGTDLHDYFIDPTGKKPKIDLQTLLKNALQNNTKKEVEKRGGNKFVISLNEFTIYLKNPPRDENDYLKYIPNNNGKNPTASTPEIVKGFLEYKPSYRSGLWFHHVPLSAEKLEQVLEKREEQRHNRRHVGDSPLPT